MSGRVGGGRRPSYQPLLPGELQLNIWLSSSDLERFHTDHSMVIGSSGVGYGALVGLDVGCFIWETSSNVEKRGQVNGFLWSFSHKK